MDYSCALGAQLREVEERDRDGKPARVVAASRTYATSRTDLWDALTNAERISRWFLPITGDLKLGGRYELEGNASGEITRCDPPEAFDVTWEFAGNTSWVTVRLEHDGTGTRLSLEHTMLKDEDGEEHWRQFGPGATGVGWDLSFLVIAIHLESGGAAIDREANEALMASEPGRSFIRSCADEWSAAHVKSGEQSIVAREMARRTAQAYAGG